MKNTFFKSESDLFKEIESNLLNAHGFSFVKSDESDSLMVAFF